ncbi:MAG: lipopolysaccharide transport periplasmic protein LptA [Rudaea sp.]|nr:lipopolysaccharide transport periplasmic protein LptA [Rudaea sp.]
MQTRLSKLLVHAGLACGLLHAAGAAALSTDRDQQLFIDANHQKSTQSQSNTANEPNITYLDGNVVMTQGSMKAHGDHATIYQNPSGVLDADGKSGSLTRVLLVGKQAHMQQVHDGDCSLMTGDADTIDFHNDTSLAVLTGHVVVVQKDKGEFHGEHMVYNTKTGEMESGDNSPTSRVHVIMEPKNSSPAPASTNNCGFPVGTSTAAAKKAKPAAPKPGDNKPEEQH